MSPLVLRSARLASLATLIGLAACATTTSLKNLAPPPTVSALDVSRYVGTWYEIARFEESFEKDCFAATATYTPQKDGTLTVDNVCHQGSVTGPAKSANGRARVVDPADPAKLEVSFFGPFWADYWVLEVGPDYDYAVVGHPSRDHLWILSRKPTLPAERLDAIKGRLTAIGYDTERLQWTPQAG